MKSIKLTPWLWFSPIALNSNSSTLPTLLAILLPVSPAPAAGKTKTFKKISSPKRGRSLT